MTMQTTTAGSDLGLRVLAQVDGELDAAALAAIEPYEGDEPYWPDYVDANFPRDWEVTDTVVEATKGHAIANEAGEIIARFEGDRDGKTSYQRAMEAVAGAKVSLNLELPTQESAPSNEQTQTGQEVS